MNRILYIKNLNDARNELKKINVSSQGVEVMATKALGSVIKLTDVKIGAANILKQEMLSLGGDAAVARGVVNGAIEKTDVILLGNASKIKKLIKKLDYQTIFGLPAIKKDLKNLLKELYKIDTKQINCNGKVLTFDTTKIMGILNVTPDSFSDGNLYFNIDDAIARAKQLINEGADFIDIGGESSRPGSKRVGFEEEYKRVIPVIKAIREFSGIPISVDTYKSEIAKEAISAGADIINDISALRFDGKMIEILKDNPNVPIILMHMKGTPENMQKNPHYEDTIEEILEFFRERIDFCLSNGIEKERIIIDPGIGFGKRQEDNLIILKKLEEFHSFGVPLLLGASRKSFIGKIYPSDATERLEGTLATTAKAFYSDVEIVRVHDVLQNKKLLDTLKAIEDAK